MEEKNRDAREVHNHFEAGANCQVFNGPISGAIFAMPGSTVNQYTHETKAVEVEEAESVEEGEELAEEPASEPPLNYFAPQKNLQELLKQAWFKAVRTKDVYDEEWTDGFIEALMESEYRDGIARDWAVQGKRNKRTQIKGHIAGLLVDADVLKGSYDSIAKEVGLTDDPRSFSRYMSQGKRQAYADWVKEYVTH